MPIYEYYCASCNRIFSFLVRNVRGHGPPSCPRCGRPRLERRPSRFTPARGHSAPADSAEANEGTADRRILARMMREIGREAGERFDPRFEEALDRVERGEDPEQVEADMESVLHDGGGSESPTVDDGLHEA